MLLTNTINAQTIDTTIATGNVTVCGVASRGCSAVPAPAAHDAKPSSRRDKRARLFFEAAMHRMASSELLQWRYRWLHRLMSQSSASQHALGFVSGCRLS